MCDKRLWFVFLIVIVSTGLFCWRLFNLQIVEGGEWRAQAQGQQRIFTQAQGDRGNIYLNSNGDPVVAATNKKVYHAYISPRRIKEEEKESFASLFADLLDVEKEDVLKRMKKDSAYEVIKRNLSEEEKEVVERTEELYIQEELTRFYPENDFASHVLGFVGGENRGQYGVEQYYEKVLQGKVGMREGLKNPLGTLILNDSIKRGEDLFLTIDYNVQHFVERELEERVEQFDARSGMAIVMNPKTGEVMAMANYPEFDPNKYNKFESSVFKNSAMQSVFEPGSVFKPITMAIALDEDAVNPEDTFLDTGSVQIHGRTIYNYARRSYGEVDMSRILENSINTGIVYVKDRVGNETFLDYLHEFGFFEPTGIDLHGEVYSKNRSFLEGHEVNFATASYGQGINVTAVQLMRAFSALANNGEMVDPYVVQREEYYIPSGEQVISAETASLVTEMMINTIEDGFGSTAKVPGYYIAGKTGTAQIPWSSLGVSRRGYSDKTMQGFIGFAPALDPEFMIYVSLDDPWSRSAEVSAAPLFKEISEFLFEYKRIPPDYAVTD